MKNFMDFEDFLRCCRLQKLRKIYLAELCLAATPAAADFGSIVLAFEADMYFVTSKYLCDSDEEIDEFCVQRIHSLDDICHKTTQEDIYRTLSFEEEEAQFLTELVNEDGYFDGMEWKMPGYFLFITVSAPALIVHASIGENTKYLLYSHQFGEGNEEYEESYVQLFPEG